MKDYSNTYVICYYNEEIGKNIFYCGDGKWSIDIYKAYHFEGFEHGNSEAESLEKKLGLEEYTLCVYEIYHYDEYLEEWRWV